MPSHDSLTNTHHKWLRYGETMRHYLTNTKHTTCLATSNGNAQNEPYVHVHIHDPENAIETVKRLEQSLATWQQCRIYSLQDQTDKETPYIIDAYQFLHKSGYPHEAHALRKQVHPQNNEMKTSHDEQDIVIFPSLRDAVRTTITQHHAQEDALFTYMYDALTKQQIAPNGMHTHYHWLPLQNGNIARIKRPIHNEPLPEEDLFHLAITCNLTIDEVREHIASQTIHIQPMYEPVASDTHRIIPLATSNNNALIRRNIE